MHNLYNKFSEFLRKVTSKFYSGRDPCYVKFTVASFCSFAHPNAQKYAHILDVGGKHGLQAQLLLNELPYASITVLDINRAHLLKGKSMYSTLSFVRGDAHHLPFRLEAFDLVYSFSLLEHLVKPDIAVREQMIVSKGLIVAQISNVQYLIEPHTKIPFLFLYPCKARDKVIKVTKSPYTNFDVTYKNLIQWFSQAGMDMIDNKQLYHVKWSKILLSPQGYLTIFKGYCARELLT